MEPDLNVHDFNHSIYPPHIFPLQLPVWNNSRGDFWRALMHSLPLLWCNSQCDKPSLHPLLSLWCTWTHLILLSPYLKIFNSNDRFTALTKRVRRELSKNITRVKEKSLVLRDLLSSESNSTPNRASLSRDCAEATKYLFVQQTWVRCVRHPAWC